MALIGGVSVGGSQGKSTEDSLDESDTTATKTNTTDMVSAILNSGHTDTGTNTTKSNNSTNTVNSGSVNTTVVGGSNSSTYNSGHTDTTQTILTPEATNHLIDQMLSSNQGLAAVSSGEKASGGYNTTTNQMLVNDLISRVAGEVAVRGAKTVTNVGGSSSTTTNSGNTTTQNIGGSTSKSDTNGLSVTDLINNVGASTQTNATHSSSVDDLVTNTLSTAQKDATNTVVKEEAHAGWIVCTELLKQGRMSRKFYMHGLRAFSKYDEQSKKGYYIWAVPAVKHLRRNPYSLLSRFLCVMLNARAEYLSAEAGEPTAKKTVLGYIAKQCYWGCWLLSRTVAKNYKVSLGEVYNANA